MSFRPMFSCVSHTYKRCGQKNLHMSAFLVSVSLSICFDLILPRVMDHSCCGICHLMQSNSASMSNFGLVIKQQ